MLKSFCWMGFIHFDLRQNKVQEHSADYMALFERVHTAVPERSLDLRSVSDERHP